MKKRQHTILGGSILAAAAIALTLISFTGCKKAPPAGAADTKSSAGQEAVEWEYEQVTVAELKPVPLNDVFDEAKAALASGDRKSSAGHIEAVAGFFDREAKTRHGDAQEAFVGYGEELHQLAGRLNSGDAVADKDLETAFARSHLALALDHAGSAEAALTAGNQRGAGSHIRAAIAHSRHALKWARTEVPVELSKAGEEAREAAAKLESGAVAGGEKAAAAVKKAKDYVAAAAERVEAFVKESAAKTKATVEEDARTTGDALRKTAAKTEDAAKVAKEKAKDTTGKAVEKTGEAIEKTGEKIKGAGEKIERPAPAPQN